MKQVPKATHSLCPTLESGPCDSDLHLVTAGTATSETLGGGLPKTATLTNTAHSRGWKGDFQATLDLSAYQFQNVSRNVNLPSLLYGSSARNLISPPCSLKARLMIQKIN